jgi:SAM-dependent methyltransferase
MKSVGPCPVCGSSDWQDYSRSAPDPARLHFAQAKCAKCGMIASDPQATESEMEAYYSKAYYETQWPDPRQIVTTNRAAYAACEIPVMESLGLRLGTFGGRRAAETGCGYGAMLSILRERNIRAAGCDLSESALAFCRSEGLNVARGKFPGLPFAPASFDLVISMHVIEHVAAPFEFIGELASLLRPGGQLVLVTEDASSSQEALEVARARIRGRLPRFRSSADHTFLFGRAQLERLCRRAGLDDVRVTGFSRPPLPESPHWKLYKGILRACDRIRRSGDFQMAVATRAASRDAERR